MSKATSTTNRSQSAVKTNSRSHRCRITIKQWQFNTRAVCSHNYFYKLDLRSTRFANLRWHWSAIKSDLQHYCRPPITIGVKIHLHSTQELYYYKGIIVTNTARALAKIGNGQCEKPTHGTTDACTFGDRAKFNLIIRNSRWFGIAKVPNMPD